MVGQFGEVWVVDWGLAKVIVPDGQDDAEPQEAARWLARAGCCWMIHGHTHRPRDHWHDGSLRQVLSDWDLDGAHDGGRPRAQAIWLEREDAALAVRRASISG
jgi:UDP-2,3-diacylglucosamine hydrolase